MHLVLSFPISFRRGTYETGAAMRRDEEGASRAAPGGDKESNPGVDGWTGRGRTREIGWSNDRNQAVWQPSRLNNSFFSRVEHRRSRDNLDLKFIPFWFYFVVFLLNLDF